MLFCGPVTRRIKAAPAVALRTVFQVKLLLDIEVQRRQDLEKMQEERVELMEILNSLKREQDQARPRCHHCANRNAAASPSAGAGGGGKVTTL